MKKIITPRDGVRVRKPDGKFLEEAGETLEFSSYWHRRYNDGDVMIAEVPIIADAATAQTVQTVHTTAKSTSISDAATATTTPAEPTAAEAQAEPAPTDKKDKK